MFSAVFPLVFGNAPPPLGAVPGRRPGAARGSPRSSPGPAAAAPLGLCTGDCDNTQRPGEILLNPRSKRGPRNGPGGQDGSGAALSGHDLGRGPDPDPGAGRRAGRGWGGPGRPGGRSGAERVRSGRGKERSGAGSGGSGMAARGSAGDAALRRAAEQWLLWDKVRGGSGQAGGGGVAMGAQAGEGSGGAG